MRHQKYRARIVPDDHDQIQGRQERTTRVGQKHRAKTITAPENIFDAIDLAILRRQQSFSFQGKSYYFQYVGNTLREDLHAIEETNQDLSNLWYNQEMTKRNPIMSFCKTQ